MRCTKNPLKSRRDAVRSMKSMADKRTRDRTHRLSRKLKVYFCLECAAWHVGHESAPMSNMPKLKKKGKKNARRSDEGR